MWFLDTVGEDCAEEAEYYKHYDPLQMFLDVTCLGASIWVDNISKKSVRRRHIKTGFSAHSFLCLAKTVCSCRYSLRSFLVSRMALISLSSSDRPSARASATAEDSLLRISRPLYFSRKSSLTQSIIFRLFLICLSPIMLRNTLKMRSCCFSLVPAL